MSKGQYPKWENSILQNFETHHLISTPKFHPPKEKRTLKKTAQSFRKNQNSLPLFHLKNKQNPSYNGSHAGYFTFLFIHFILVFLTSWISFLTAAKSASLFFCLQQPQIILLKEGTDTSQGKAQLVSNINACTAVADVVRTTLGPRGMDKLIHDDKGNVTISNDGATIMKLLDIVHPAAKILVDIAKSQDSEVTVSPILLFT